MSFEAILMFVDAAQGKTKWEFVECRSNEKLLGRKVLKQLASNGDEGCGILELEGHEIVRAALHLEI